MSDWIEHDGKCQPVEDGVMVCTRFPCGSEDGPFPAHVWLWEHQKASYDIVAYRVIQDPSSQAIDDLIEASSEELDVPSFQANREGEEQ